MGFLAELFGRNKVTSIDLKTQLRRIERERRKKRLELKKLDTRQNQLIEQIKDARKMGQQLDVDYMWEDLKGLKIDKTFLIREATVLNLEGITVKKYLRGMERMERNKDQNGINKLLQRIRSSSLDSKLDEERIRTDEYLDELRAILEDVGMDMESMDEADEDPEKLKFLEDIDAVIAAEESGDLETAKEREEGLKQQLEEEPSESEQL